MPAGVDRSKASAVVQPMPLIRKAGLVVGEIRVIPAEPGRCRGGPHMVNNARVLLAPCLGCVSARHRVSMGQRDKDDVAQEHVCRQPGKEQPYGPPCMSKPDLP